MNKSGGIVALIANIFAVSPAIAMLIFALIGSTVADDDIKIVIIFFGLTGIFFTYTNIALAAICLNAKSKSPSVWLIISSIVGIILTGPVAIFMILSLIGGIITLKHKYE